MGANAFSLADNITKTKAQVVTGNGLFDLWVSPNQSLPQGATSLRIIVDYDEVLPLFGDNPLTFEMSLLIEALNGGKWFPIAYQFDGFRTAHQGKKRIVLLSPDLTVADAGYDEIMYAGGDIFARISRQQGFLAATWRARIIIRESEYGGLGSFQSLRFSVYGETF